MTSRRRWLVPVTLASALALLFFSPLRWRCPVALVLGVPCPICGMTRAVWLALRGDFAAATAMHPLVWLVAPLFATMLVLEVVGYLREGRWGGSARVRGSSFVFVAVATLLFMVWIARFFGALGGRVPVSSRHSRHETVATSETTFCAPL